MSQERDGKTGASRFFNGAGGRAVPGVVWINRVRASAKLEPSPLEVITFLTPDILVKGGDWDLDQVVGRESVESRGGTVHTLPLIPGISTTSLIEKIQALQVEECAKRVI